MAIRLIFLNHRMSVISEGGTEKGRRSGCWTSRYKLVGGEGRQIRSLVQRREVMSTPSFGEGEVVDPMLPRKSSIRELVR